MVIGLGSWVRFACDRDIYYHVCVCSGGVRGISAGSDHIVSSVSSAFGYVKNYCVSICRSRRGVGVRGGGDAMVMIAYLLECVLGKSRVVNRGWGLSGWPRH